MATKQDINIRKGRTESFVVTVTGVSSWTNLLSKLFASKKLEQTTPDITLTGVIDTDANTITFTFLYATTASLKAGGYQYIVTIYKADKTYVREPNYGILSIDEVPKVDPTS